MTPFWFGFLAGFIFGGLGAAIAMSVLMIGRDGDNPG